MRLPNKMKKYLFAQFSPVELIFVIEFLRIVKFEEF